MANLPEVLQANLDTNQKVTKNQEQLQQAMRAFTASNKTFAKTSTALNDFAKKQVGNLNPFKSLKKKFDESFVGQNLARKKEEETLAKAAGITREELLLLKADKELKESQKAQADQLKASLEEYGLNVNTFFNEAGELQTRMAERDEKGRFQSAQTIVDGIVGSMEDGKMQEIENRREQGRRDDEQTALMGSLVGGIKGLGKSLLDGLKGLGEKGGMGVGMLFGIIAAPVIALVSFFKQLGTEFKFLNKLTGGKLGKVLEPFKRFGDFIKGLGNKFKGFATDKFGKSIDKGKSLFTKFSDFFKNNFGKGSKFANMFKIFGEGFKPVAKFASAAGRLLGKLFLPVTVIMGIIDAVKGFMEGFSEEGIVGGLYGAYEGVLTGLIAIPLDLVKGMISWVAEKLGFEGVSEKLDSFSFAGLFAKLFDWIQDTRLAISDWIADKLLSLRALLPSFLGGMSEDEVEAERAKRLLERSERDQKIMENRLKKQAKAEGITVDELKKRIEGQGTESGGTKGAQVNAQSAQAAGASGKVVVTTVAPTNINAPSSTNVSNQTNVTPTATRSRTRTRGRGRSAYA